jgi:hypothetical protein
VSKTLDEEVAAASNTKREIKTLITQLTNSARGLIQWGRHTGKVSANTSNRGTQTDQEPPELLPTTKEHPKTTEALPGSHITKATSARSTLENLVPSLDHSRFEIPAAIKALHQMV